MMNHMQHLKPVWCIYTINQAVLNTGRKYAFQLKITLTIQSHGPRSVYGHKQGGVNITLE